MGADADLPHGLAIRISAHGRFLCEASRNRSSLAQRGRTRMRANAVPRPGPAMDCAWMLRPTGCAGALTSFTMYTTVQAWPFLCVFAGLTKPPLLFFPARQSAAIWKQPPWAAFI